MTDDTTKAKDEARAPLVVNIEDEPPMPVVLLHPTYGLIEFKPEYLAQLCAERDAEWRAALAGPGANPKIAGPHGPEEAWTFVDEHRNVALESRSLPEFESVVLGRYRGRIFEFRRTELREGHGMAPPVPWMWQRLVNNGWYAADPPEEWAPMPTWSPGIEPPRNWGERR